MSLDVENDFSAPMPDFAVTFSITPRDFYIASQIRQIKAAHGSSKTWKEAEKEAEDEWKLLSEDEQNLYACEKGKCENRTLDYLWPVFRWESISDGFESKKVSEGLDLAGAGGRRALRGRLRPERQLQRRKRRPLARLLLPQQQASAGEAEKLRGRDFGDPIWSYLDLRIVRCTNMSAAEVENEKGWTNVSMPFPEAWSGNCAPHGDIDALVDYEDGLPSTCSLICPRSLTGPNRAGTVPRPPEENSMVGVGPTMSTEKMSSSSPMQCRLYLKHTEAMINWPLSLGLSLSESSLSWPEFRRRRLRPIRRWFEYDRTECQRSHRRRALRGDQVTLYRWDWSGHAMGENRTRFFDTSVRMNHKRRSLDVRRQNILEMLSDIGGSWEPSFFLGWLVVVVINRALMAASACPAIAQRSERRVGQERGRGAPAPLQRLQRPRRRRRQRPSRRRRQRPRRRRRHQRPRPRHLPARLPPRGGGSSWR